SRPIPAAAPHPGHTASTTYLRSRRARTQARRLQGRTGLADAPRTSPADPPPPSTLLTSAWDASYDLLQQWGMEVEVCLGWEAAQQQDTFLDSGQQAFVIEGGLGPGGEADGEEVGSTGLASALSASEARQTPAGSSARDAPAGSAARSATLERPGALCVSVSVTLKSLMPELSAPATVLVLRIADRLLTYQKYQKWWAQRPAVSVRQLPGAWWQHACQAVTAECRSRYPVRQMRQSLALRAQYIQLYRMLHSRQPYFAKDRARGPREQAVPAKALAAQLQELERKLTLAQAMMYRTCVALRHSIYLGRHEEEYLKCLTAMDLLATFVDALPQASPSPLETTSRLRVSVRCPRLGLHLVCQAPAAGHGPRPGHGPKGEAAPMTAAPAQAARQARSHAAAVVLSVEGVQLLMPSLTSLVVQ
ncbi:hypothetical protein QJQ45_019684, partial [Haematococcus lacustris]